MNFTNITIKNLKHNLTKFTSYIFVNTFVICILFMYGSIVFNGKIANDPVLSGTMQFVEMGVIAIVIYSVAFISYTGISFVKSRGKELGVYLTLGMTKNDVIKMIVIESTVIMLISVVLGVGFGLVFSGLFYLVLGNVLDAGNLFYIDGWSFLLSIGVFLAVFVSNIIFSTIFIKGSSITDIIKSDKTKGMKEPKRFEGFLSILLFVVSTTMLYLMITDNEIVADLSDKATKVIFVNVALQFISLYFMIAVGLDFVVAMLSKRKDFYNRNILILSNIRYSFTSYKTSLFMLTLLIGMSIFFMGVPLSFRVSTINSLETVLPYDFMIENKGDINNISKDEIYSLVEENGGEISQFISFPYVTNEIYRENDTWLFNYGTTTMLVSESDFNNAFGTDYSVEPDELLMVSNYGSQKEIDYDTWLVVDDWESGENRANKIRQERPSREDFINGLDSEGVQYLSYEQEKTSSVYQPFVNCYGSMEYAYVVANVIDDDVYNSLVNTEITNSYQFDLASGDDTTIYNAILEELRVKNNDSSLWATEDFHFEDKNTAEAYKPISKQQSTDVTLKMVGMFSFTMIFISILFLISSTVVIYYKIVNDTDYEREQINLFKKLGLTNDECVNYLDKRSGIIFFAPMVLGGLVGLFYTYAFFYNAPDRSHLLLIVSVMYLLFILFDVVFFFIVRKSLRKSVGV